jgi:hypothetical protein
MTEDEVHFLRSISGDSRCKIDTAGTDRSVSYLELHLEIDSEGRLRSKPYDKRDDLNLPIVNFPFICSNIEVMIST